MLNFPCRVLLVEDELDDIETVQTMLRDVRSPYFQQGFELTSAKTLAEARKILSAAEFEVVLLDLVLPDSRHIDSLQILRARQIDTPIIVQTALEDEVVAVKALELGASGYLPKAASDRNLLLYAIRTAIERKQQLAEMSQSQQQELDDLSNLMHHVSKIERDDCLKQRIPDIFSELQTRYQQLLDRFVEQKIYRVEDDLSSQIDKFIEQLGYLQATPKDLIELHTISLKQKKSLSQQSIKTFMIEGRYLLLESMGRLVVYYRRYYIGLNKINLTQNYPPKSQGEPNGT